MELPFFGFRQIRNILWDEGHRLGRERVRRLMRKMGSAALRLDGYRLLCGHPGRSLESLWRAGNIQHGPKLAFYLLRVHADAQRDWNA